MLSARSISQIGELLARRLEARRGLARPRPTALQGLRRSFRTHWNRHSEAIDGSSVASVCRTRFSLTASRLARSMRSVSCLHRRPTGPTRLVPTSPARCPGGRESGTKACRFQPPVQSPARVDCSFPGEPASAPRWSRSLKGATVFGIDWLRNGLPIEKETSVLADEAETVAVVRRRAPEVLKRHPGREPDTFRLTDASGKIVGVFPIRRGS
jgi:hypothetical protein